MRMNRQEIKKVEAAFKACFQADIGVPAPGVEWRRNLMIGIGAVVCPPVVRRAKTRQEVIIWRLAWMSLAASLTLVAIFSLTQLAGADSQPGSRWEEKIFAINDIIGSDSNGQ